MALVTVDSGRSCSIFFIASFCSCCLCKASRCRCSRSKSLAFSRSEAAISSISLNVGGSDVWSNDRGSPGQVRVLGRVFKCSFAI